MIVTNCVKFMTSFLLINSAIDGPGPVTRVQGTVPIVLVMY